MNSVHNIESYWNIESILIAIEFFEWTGLFLNSPSS